MFAEEQYPVQCQLVQEEFPDEVSVEPDSKEHHVVHVPKQQTKRSLEELD
jgi:hypothetical protein